MTTNENSIVVTRVLMDDNIFEQPPEKERRSTTQRSNTSYRLVIAPKASKIIQLAAPCVLLSVICQVVLGLFANCLSLISDGARQFADHLEQHKYDRTGTPGQRITEVISIGVVSVVLMVLSVVFVVNASTRAALPIFEINEQMLLVGTVLSLSTNTVQMLVHIASWRTTRPSYSITQFALNHKNQVFHGLFNHGLAVTQLVVSALMVMDVKYYVADSIGTYIMTGLMITNIASISRHCWKEYCGLEYARGDYEEI